MQNSQNSCTRNTSDENRTAILLIRTYGDGASGEALLRLIEMRVAGNTAGEEIWRAVLKTIIEMQTV